jgi:hypothetical protein
MEIRLQNTQKSIYSTPQIELIKLDNEISLVLYSTPPVIPGEEISSTPEYFNSDSFKSCFG